MASYNVAEMVVLVPALPDNLDDASALALLYQEFDTDNVSLHVDVDDRGRVIDQPFAIVWLHRHPTRTRANELAGQQAVARRAGELLGLEIPLWGANPYADAARELTTPITFRIHSATLDRVRAYAREHGLKTDGEALRALIEAGLTVPAVAH